MEFYIKKLSIGNMTCSGVKNIICRQKMSKGAVSWINAVGTQAHPSASVELLQESQSNTKQNRCQRNIDLY